MMTREEILSIEEYCAEHKISHKKRLEELGIPFWHFYKAKQKYRRADEQDALNIGMSIKMTDRLLVDPDHGVCFSHMNGGIIDGQGNYIWANTVTEGDCTIKTAGGTIKNIGIWQCYKAINIVAPTQKVSLHKVVVPAERVSKYAIHCDSGNGYGLEATECEFYRD